MLHKCTTLLFAFLASPVLSTPVPLIIDTDLGFDVDDVGAIAIGNHLHDKGEADLLAVIHCTGWDQGIAGVNLINSFYRRNSTILGAYKGAWGTSARPQDGYVSQTMKALPEFAKVKDFNDPSVLDGIEAYVQALSGAANHSVVIASIGEPIVLRLVLQQHKDLVAQKVAKVVYMNGNFNFGCAGGNYGGDAALCKDSAKDTVRMMPKSVRQVFQIHGSGKGCTDANAICTGCRFVGANQCGGDRNSVQYMYANSFAHGCRYSWDPITVYLAVKGDDALYSSAAAGTDHIGTGGDLPPAGYFDRNDHNNNQFWIDMETYEHKNDIQNILESALCARPAADGPPPPPAPHGQYTQAAGKNCYGARNGQPAHGSTDLEHPASASCGQMSLPECETKCDELDGCDGVTVRSVGGGNYDCYRKGSIDISRCDSNTQFDTYVKGGIASFKGDLGVLTPVPL